MLLHPDAKFSPISMAACCLVQGCRPVHISAACSTQNL